MARYDAEHKLATRRRIVETAGRRFKSDGIDGSGIAVLMADAGLTNGAFYAHFSSKNDLVATVIGEQLRAQRDGFAALPPGRAPLEAYIRGYLSAEHRDNPSEGCPSAALLDEIGRCDEATRQVYTEGSQAIVDVLAAHLSPRDPAASRGKALALYSCLVGSLQLARAVTDPALSAEVLEQGVTTALRLLR